MDTGVIVGAAGAFSGVIVALIGLRGKSSENVASSTRDFMDRLQKELEEKRARVLELEAAFRIERRAHEAEIDEYEERLRDCRQAAHDAKNRETAVHLKVAELEGDY